MSSNDTMWYRPVRMSTGEEGWEEGRREGEGREGEGEEGRGGRRQGREEETGEGGGEKR